MDFGLVLLVNDMEKFQVEIRKDIKYLEVEFSGNTPCLLADEIRKVVKEFYKDEDKG